MRDIGKLLHIVIPLLPSVALLGSSYDHGEIQHLGNLCGNPAWRQNGKLNQ